MLTAFVPMLGTIGVLGAFTDAWVSSGPHLLYALRLIGALLVATLVPTLIDRRARRR